MGARYGESPLVRVLVWSYLAFWGWMAFAPLDRETWLLENGLAFVLWIVLLVTHRHFAFSQLSCVLLFVFLLMHAFGSHYTYSKVPIGFWVQDWLGLARNHYDRAVHLAFGLLLAYPMREVLLRLAHLHGAWSYIAPPAAVLTFSSLYEIIESWAAQVMDPEVGMAYVGAQGDVWDGQKDMSLAFAGSIVAMALTAVWHWRTGREPYLLGAAPERLRPRP